jgi:hypothetical protein
MTHRQAATEIFGDSVFFGTQSGFLLHFLAASEKFSFYMQNW